VNEHRDALGGRDRARLEMHMEAEAEWTQRASLEMQLQTEIE